jgi:PAS domain S-box-containing protein
MEATLPSSQSDSVPPTILERVSDGVVGLDREWNYTYINDSALRLLQKRADEVLGRSIWEVFNEAVDSPVHGAMHRAMATQNVCFVEDHYAPLHSWFECRIYPSPNGLTVFFHDITERKRTQALLVGQARVLEQIAHGDPLESSLDTLLRLIETQCPDMRSSVLLLDESDQTLHHGAAPSLPACFTGPLDGTRIGPSAGSCGVAAFTREPVVTQDIANDPHWAPWRELALSVGLRACWSTPIFDDTQRLLGTFAMYYAEPSVPSERDLGVVQMATHIAAIAIGRHRAEQARSEQERVRQKNRELEESNRVVQEASRLKSQFLANMSHELRTPLNAINGFSEYLIDQHAGPLTAKQLECMQHVLSSGRHLLQLVSDVLDLAKVEAGKMEVFPEPCALCEILSEVCAVVNGLASDKGVALKWRCDPPLERATIDVQKFKQVLFNLIANAVKFTNRGGLVEVTARELDEARFEVRVRDTGIGISAEDVPKLFQRFQQLDSTASRRHAGTGLGLALAKRLVESMDGTIGVESELGVGSTFYCVLPRQLPTRRAG